MEHDGDRLRRLTSSKRTVSQPVWSPDGRKIAFVTGDVDDSTHHLLVMNADTTGLRRLATDVAFLGLSRQTWARDGRSLVYVSRAEVATIVGLDGSRRTLARNADAAAWSPVGS